MEKKAEIIIHCKSSIFHLLVKDGYYRNRFETKTSGGTLDENIRMEWENNLFDNLYHNAEGIFLSYLLILLSCYLLIFLSSYYFIIIAYDRVKYGCLNLLNAPAGVGKAYQYGYSHLILKDNLRDKVTLSQSDSCESSKYPIGTLKHCCHIINFLSNDTLLNFIDVASGKFQMEKGSCVCNTIMYIEIQIHAVIQLKDIEKIICINDLSNPTMFSYKDLKLIHGYSM